MLPSTEAAQELKFKSLQTFGCCCCLCIICLFSFSLSLSLALSLLFYSILFYSVVVFVWIRTLDCLFRTTACLCTVVRLTTAPSFAREARAASRNFWTLGWGMHAPNRTVHVLLVTLPALGRYPVWRVITGGSGSGSCSPDPSGCQIVGTSTRIGWVEKKMFW
jgi:hypothetical protein